MQKLRAEMENRQYRKMVRHIIEPKGIGRIKDSMEMRDATSQLSVGLNIIVTMFSCFVVGSYLGSKFFNDQVLVSNPLCRSPQCRTNQENRGSARE